MSDFKVVKLLNPIEIVVNVNPKGAYNPATSYLLGDIVEYNGSGYIAIEPTTGNPPTDISYWQLLAAGVPITNIEALADVSVSGKTAGDLLEWDALAGKWKNVAPLLEAGQGTVGGVSQANLSEGVGYLPGGPSISNLVRLQEGTGTDAVGPTSNVTVRFAISYDQTSFSVNPLSEEEVAAFIAGTYPLPNKPNFAQADNHSETAQPLFLAGQMQGARVGEIRRWRSITPAYQDNIVQLIAINSNPVEAIPNGGGLAVGVIKTNVQGLLDDSFVSANIARVSDVAAEASARAAALNLKLDSSLAGANDGIATLDSNGKVPEVQLPNAIMEYAGEWTGSDVAASVNTTIPGTSDVSQITADNPGVAGNSISIPFDGAMTLDDSIAAYNLANPSATVTLNSPVGSEVPLAGSIGLSGGSSANNPVLANGSGNSDSAIGTVYKVTVGGDVDFGDGPVKTLLGDYLVLNPNKTWEAIPTSLENFEAVNGLFISDFLTNKRLKIGISNSGVTTLMLANGSVTSAKIASNAVTSSQIASNAVTSSQIASNAVTTTKISNGAVTGIKISSDTITATNLTSASITNPKIAQYAVTGHKISLLTNGADWITASNGAVNLIAAGTDNTIWIGIPLNLQNANKIINLVDPTDAQDAATKNYADTKVTANAAISASTKLKITYDSKGLVTAGTDASLNDLSDVAISNPSLNQVLTYNGANWVNGSGAVVNPGPGVTYFLSTVDGGIMGYETISRTPDTTAEVDETIACNSSITLLHAYIADAPLGKNSIDAGIWEFNYFAYVGSDNAQIRTEVYSRNTVGTEVLLFTVDTDVFNNTEINLITASSVQPSFSCTSTDKLVIKVYGKSNYNNTLHILHSGSEHYSHFHTPLTLAHNDIAGLQGGLVNQYYHLTNSEYVGIGTGNFVRESALGSYVPTSRTINGHALVTDVTVTKSDVGLGNVDNVSAADLRNRSTHTGTQLASTISDFTETAQDVVANALTDSDTVGWTYDDSSNTLTASIKNDSITDVKIASGIDAAKISDGQVSNTEFGYLDGVTSAIQTQLNGKEPTITAGTTAQYWRGDKTWQTLNTTSVIEGTNLYYTDERADFRISAQKAQPNGLATLDANSYLPTVQHGNYSNGLHHATATTSVNGFMSASDKLKLDGIQVGATANSSDSFLLNRANHTGTQLASTISDFTEAAQDAIGGILVNTSTVNFTYSDAGNTIGADVNDNSITNTKIASGIDAVKIGTGVVSNTEFGYLDGVTSAIQTQLNGKEPTIASGTTAEYWRGDKTWQNLSTAIDARITTQKGQPNGLAPLDSTGLISSVYLPSYVDDVLEYSSLAAFPVTGETGKIYVAADTGKIYRWSGSIYIEIMGSPGTTDSLVEGTTNLYFTVERAQDATALALTNTSTINFAYDDNANTITATLNDGSVTNAKIASGIDAVKIGTGVVSNTEFGYLDGVTSAIQTQLNGKEPTISLTVNRAVVSDTNGKVAVSATTSTEIGYVSGVTSAIQTQLDGKLSTSGGSLSGTLNMNSNSITNVSDPVNNQDAATKFYVEYVGGNGFLDGGTPTSNFDSLVVINGGNV